VEPATAAERHPPLSHAQQSQSLTVNLKDAVTGKARKPQPSYLPGIDTYLVRPRSFLIIGNLKDLRRQGGVHREKYESFELYRRNLYEPEVITFDELLARAEWHVEILDEGSGVLVDADTDVDIADDESES
jgi:antiviral defense system Shedu protein SduA